MSKILLVNKEDMVCRYVGRIEDPWCSAYLRLQELLLEISSIPKSKYLSGKQMDFSWLKRNIPLRCKSHPDFIKIMGLIEYLNNNN